METKVWYEAKTGNHQGLIIDEKTGRNIAVAYDKADAPLIAATPELLAVVRAFIEAWDNDSAAHLEQAARDGRALAYRVEVQ